MKASERWNGLFFHVEAIVVKIGKAWAYGIYDFTLGIGHSGYEQAKVHYGYYKRECEDDVVR